MLSAVSTKLEDTLRGVERLRTATGVVGQTTFSQLCRQMNLAGDCLDDIPDRRTLRQLIEALEREAGATPLRQNGNGHAGSSANRTDPEARQRTGRCPCRPGPRGTACWKAAEYEGFRRHRSRSERGVSGLAELRRLTADSLPAVTAARDVLRQVTQ